MNQAKNFARQIVKGQPKILQFLLPTCFQCIKQNCCCRDLLVTAMNSGACRDFFSQIAINYCLFCGFFYIAKCQTENRLQA